MKSTSTKTLLLGAFIFLFQGKDLYSIEPSDTSKTYNYSSQIHLGAGYISGVMISGGYDYFFKRDSKIKIGGKVAIQFLGDYEQQLYIGPVARYDFFNRAIKPFVKADLSLSGIRRSSSAYSYWNIGTESDDEWLPFFIGAYGSLSFGIHWQPKKTRTGFSIRYQEGLSLEKRKIYSYSGEDTRYGPYELIRNGGCALRVTYRL